MVFWVFWCGAEGGEGPRIGPFHDRQDAERHMQGELRRFAAKLVHGTGEEGTWTTAGELYRGGLLDDVMLGRFIIEEVAPDDA